MKEPFTGAVKRVAAYCRVSTDSSDQVNSLESQRRYFRDCINSNPAWELYEIYADEGISGTDTKKRVAFNRMIADARAHCFDLIITKEISRFARNVLDSIGYTRELRRIGVGVYFLNDNINTLDPDAELRLTIMSSIAQEESRRTSQRCKWGQRRRMEQGVVFGRDMLGYDVRGGRLSVNEEGAAVVRRIFHMYLDEGKGAHRIAKQLCEEGIRTSRYMKNWSYTVIMRVLKNEKYCGDLVQQKTFTPDYLTHAKKRNKGELERVVIRDHHEPIVSRELFDAVQEEIGRRKDMCKVKESYSNRYALSGRIRCGECGAKYIHTVRSRGGDKSRYENWSCTRKLRRGCSRADGCRDDTGCDNVNIRDADLKQTLTDIIREIMRGDTDTARRAIGAADGVIRSSGNNSPVSCCETRLQRIKEKKHRLLELCLSADIRADEYREEAERLNTEYRQTLRRLSEEKERAARAPDRADVMAQVKKHIGDILSGEQWDEVFYRQIVERIDVFRDRTLLIRLYQLPQPCRARVLRGKQEINRYTEGTESSA